jgi:hypothetical protein
MKNLGVTLLEAYVFTKVRYVMKKIRNILIAGSVIALVGLANATGAAAVSSSGVDLSTPSSGKADTLICHKGKEMYVSFFGALGHLVHGDNFGPCGSGES